MLDWIQSIDRALIELDEKPQWIKTRPLPIEEVTRRIQELLQDKSIVMTVQEEGWVQEELFSQKWAHQITLPPLTEACYLLIEGRELLAFIAEESMVSLPKEVTEPFVSYFIAEMLHSISLTGAFKPLGLRLQNEKVELKKESYYQVNLSLSGKKGQVWMTLLFPPSFRKSWNNFFAAEPSLPLTEEQKERLNVSLGIEAGKVKLPLEQLKKIEKGDFLLIENGLYDPETKKGQVLLTLNTKPILRANLQEGVITVIDNSLFEEGTIHG